MSLWSWFKGLFDKTPIRLAVVRRYCDAQGSYVGELYLHETVKRQHDTVEGFVMIGASLDTLPLEADKYSRDGLTQLFWTLDTRNDFLAPIMGNVLRVGALEPQENDAVRKRVSRLPRSRIVLTIQNRFIEQVIESSSHVD